MGAFYILPRRKILQEVTENFAKYIGEFYKIHRKILQNTSENFTNIILIICIITICTVKLKYARKNAYKKNKIITERFQNHLYIRFSPSGENDYP